MTWEDSLGQARALERLRKSAGLIRSGFRATLPGKGKKRPEATPVQSST